MLQSKRKAMEKTSPATQISRGMVPFEEIDRYFAELEQNLFSRSWLRPFPWLSQSIPPVAFEAQVPKVDVIDREEDILVKAELPGIEKKDLDISITDNVITLSAKSAYEEKEEKGNYYRHEISRGSYSRTIALPAAVDIDNSKAKFRDGILELTLPKIEKAVHKKIKVE